MEGGVSDKEVLWRERIAAWKASGQSLRRFALQSGWRPRQMGYWKKRLEKVTSTTSLIPVEIKHAVAALAPITLCSPSGFTVQFPGDVSVAWLAELLRSL